MFGSDLALKIINFGYLEIIFMYTNYFPITDLLLDDYAIDLLKLMDGMGSRTFDKVFLGLLGSFVASFCLPLLSMQHYVAYLR